MRIAGTPHEDTKGNVFRPRVAPLTPPSKSTPPAVPPPAVPDVKKTPPTTPPVAGERTALDDRVEAWLKVKGCLDCHTAPSEPVLFDAAGKILPDKVERMIKVLEGKNLAHPGTMEKKIPALRAALTKEEKTLLGAWTRQHLKRAMDLPPDAAPTKAPKSLDEAEAGGLFKKGNLVATDDLKKAIEGPEKDRPTIIDVGGVGAIRGAKRVGNMDHGADEATPKLLAAALGAEPGKKIVLYCGCCPTEVCRPILSSLKLLHDAGVKDVQVLNLPFGFDEDWKDKGFPLQPD
jgi:hypothetical protein